MGSTDFFQGFSVIQFATVIAAVQNLLGVSYDQYQGNHGAKVAMVSTFAHSHSASH